MDVHRQEGGAAFLVDTLTAFMDSRGGSLFWEEGELYPSMVEGNDIVVADEPVQVHEDPDMDVDCKWSFSQMYFCIKYSI
jgi:hypothetical protein